MKTKKVQALLMATLLALSTFLSGCGNAEPKSSEVSKSSESTVEKSGEEVSKEKPEEYPVVSWYMANSEKNVIDQELVEEAANKILREAVGVELKFYFIDNGSFAEKVNVMMNSGEEFDIMTGGSKAKFGPTYNKGALLDITDLLEEYGQNVLAKADERAWETVTRQGRIYAIPNQMPYASENVLGFRKDLVEKYNLNLEGITCIDDLIPFFDAILENEPGVKPISGASGGTSMDVFLKDAKVGNYSPTGEELVVFDYEDQRMESLLEQDEYVGVLRQLHDLYVKGYIDKDVLSRTNDTDSIKAGKAATYGGSAEYTGGSKMTALYGVESLEALISRDEITTDSMCSVLTYISQSSKQPENAMKVINEIWGNPELLNLLAYGIEGVHYTVTANAGTDHPSVLPKSGEEVRWTVYHNWLGPLFDQWDSPWNSAEALKGMQERNVSAQTSQIIGYQFNTEPVKTQAAEVKAIWKEVIAVLKTGTMPDFDKYLEETKQRLVAAGLNDMINEAQKQYEEWLKMN